MTYDKSMPSHELTFWAEELGKSGDIDMAVTVLPELLDHKDRVVREGAIMGLRELKDRCEIHVDVVCKVARILVTDESRGVRCRASDFIEDYFTDD